jgi:uncharacterized protein (TIGR02145 family)
MNLSHKIILASTVSTALALFACSKHNPDNVLNPESDLYDSEMAADNNGNSIADGIEPYLEACGNDAKCAAEKAQEAKQNAKSSVNELSSTDNPSSAIPNSSITPGSSIKPASSESTNSSATEISSEGNSSIAASSAGASSSSVATGTTFKLTVIGGVIIGTGLTEGDFAKNATVKIARAPFSGGLNQCKGGWVSEEVAGDFSLDTISFSMPANEVTFTSANRTCQDTITDPRDGQMYGYMTVNAKRWLKTNANFSTGTDDFCYENNTANCDIYGRLYRFTAAASACPTGWRQPTVSEMLAAADDLALQSTGRGDQYDPPGFNYIAPNSTRISYWVIGTLEDQDLAKNCDAVDGGDCGFILTNEAGSWQIASDSKVKSYPVRCIQK